MQNFRMTFSGSAVAAHRSQQREGIRKTKAATPARKLLNPAVSALLRVCLHK